MRVASDSRPAHAPDERDEAVALLETVAELALTCVTAAVGVAVEATLPRMPEPIAAAAGSVGAGVHLPAVRASVAGTEVELRAVLSHTNGTPSGAVETTLEQLCRHGATLLAAFDAWSHERDGLRLAIEGRDVIGQAKGILVERDGLTSDGAFERLREMSQRGNTKLRELAALMVKASGGNAMATWAPPPRPARDGVPARTGGPPRPRVAP